MYQEALINVDAGKLASILRTLGDDTALRLQLKPGRQTKGFSANTQYVTYAKVLSGPDSEADAFELHAYDDMGISTRIDNDDVFYDFNLVCSHSFDEEYARADRHMAHYVAQKLLRVMSKADGEYEPTVGDIVVVKGGVPVPGEASPIIRPNDYYIVAAVLTHEQMQRLGMLTQTPARADIAVYRLDTEENARVCFMNAGALRLVGNCSDFGLPPPPADILSRTTIL